MKTANGKKLLCLLLILSVFAGPDLMPASAKFKSETKEKNTLDPAVNYYLNALEKTKKLDLDGGIDSCLQAIYFARNNYHPPAYILLGNLYRLKGEDAKAIDALQKGIVQSVGPVPDAHCDLAEVFMKTKRYNEAQAELNRALHEFRGPGPRANNLMGQLLEIKRDYDTAAQQYLYALGDPPWWYTDAWMNLAGCSMKMHQWGEAIQHYVGILARGKTLKGVDYEKVYVNLGACQLAKGDHNGALESWHRCLDINPNNAKAHLLLALMFDQERHVSSAIKEYQAYLRCSDQKTAAAKEVQARLLVLEQMIKPAEAEPARAKPSPLMRQEQEQAVAAQRQQQEMMQRAMESLSQPAGADSGF